MSVTLHALHVAEADVITAAEECQEYMTAGHLCAVFRAVMKAYEIRSKWQRRKDARS